MNTTIQQQLHDIIEDKNLHGCSFTYGVALYEGVMHGGLALRFIDAFENMAADYYPDIYDMLNNSGMHTTAQAWANILDLAMLDDMARQLAGVDEDE